MSKLFCGKHNSLLEYFNLNCQLSVTFQHHIFISQRRTSEAELVLWAELMGSKNSSPIIITSKRCGTCQNLTWLSKFRGSWASVKLSTFQISSTIKLFFIYTIYVNNKLDTDFDSLYFYYFSSPTRYLMLFCVNTVPLVKSLDVHLRGE